MAGYPWEVQNTYPPRGISSNGMDIVENPNTAEPILIGHTLAWCTELENAFNEAVALGEKHKKEKEEYFDELVAAGLRTKPKTTEEMLLEAISAINHLAEKVEKLEGERNEYKPDDRDSKGRFKSSQPKGSASTGQPATDTASD